MFENSELTGWQKPRTTKLYLHPPLAERMITIWPDFKIVNSVVNETSWQGENAYGFIVVEGKNIQQFDWKNTKFKISQDGVPIHSIEHYLKNRFFLRMESFCSIERVPVTYSRITIKNKNPWNLKDSIAIIPRSGSEIYMMGINRDGYCSYCPNIHTWGMLPCDFTFKNKILSNDNCSMVIKVDGNVNMKWIGGEPGMAFYKRNMLKFDFSIEPEAELIIDIAFYLKNENGTFAYDEEKKLTEEFWKYELGKIKKFPNTKIKLYKNMFLNLVAQLLQMFALPESKDGVMPRQGGIERGIWPTEAVEFLVALDRIGGFESYTSKAYDYLFIQQVKDGEDKGRIMSVRADSWANNTGAVIWGISQHILCLNDKDLFVRYRDKMLMGYEWIERMRSINLDNNFNGIGRGLFPPMQASDWLEKSQNWCWTDAWNIMGLREMAKLFNYYNDDLVGKISDTYENYNNSMKIILNEMIKGHEDDDELYIINKLGEASVEPPNGPYFSDGPANLIRSGIINPKSKTFKQIEAFFRNRRFMQNGLCGLMTDSFISAFPSDIWAGHTWYTTYPELCWFYGWMDAKEYDKAEATFFALQKYSMTDEFCMQERYADNDESFVPWQPNASANGRFIMMLMDYCEYLAR